MAMLNASMVPVFLIVMSTSVNTNTMDMLNALMENAFQIVTNTNVQRNMVNVSKENVYQHVTNTNAQQLVVNVSKVFARRNAVVEYLGHVQFMSELKIHTMPTTAPSLVLIWEQEYRKSLLSIEKMSLFESIQSTVWQTLCAPFY